MWGVLWGLATKRRICVFRLATRPAPCEHQVLRRSFGRTMWPRLPSSAQPPLVVQSRNQRSPDFRYCWIIPVGRLLYLLHDGRCIAVSSRRTQVLLLCYRRNYDRTIAGLGTGKAQRYLASDLDRLSSRLFDASGIEAVEVVARVSHVVRSNAVLHALRRYSSAVLDRAKSAKARLHQEVRIG
jgi:hypothetical protein